MKTDIADFTQEVPHSDLKSSRKKKKELKIKKVTQPIGGFQSLENKKSSSQEKEETNENLENLEDANNSIFVGDLPKFVTNDDLHKLFNEFGTILNIDIKYNKNTGESRGYGFIKFTDSDSCISAINNSKNITLNKDGKQIKVRINWARNNNIFVSENITNVLYVSNLVNISRNELLESFKKFGEIVAIESNVFPNLQAGIIKFASVSSAKSAKTAMDNKKLGNKNIKITFFPQMTSSPASSPVQKHVVFVHFYINSEKNINNIINEEFIINLFQKFGTIYKITLPTNENGDLKGYCFVHFNTEQNAVNAINNMNNKTINIDTNENGKEESIPATLICNFGRRNLYNRKGHFKYGAAHFPNFLIPSIMPPSIYPLAPSNQSFPIDYTNLTNPMLYYQYPQYYPQYYNYYAPSSMLYSPTTNNADISIEELEEDISTEEQNVEDNDSLPNNQELDNSAEAN